MANNNERMIFGIGFDLATGVDEVIKQWDDKESKRLQKVLDKKPLKISLEIKKNFITELRDFVRVTREVSNAQRQINKAKKEELDIAAKAAMVKTREANQRAANVRAAVQEATQQDQINKKKADAAYSEERLAQAKKNGISATHAQNSAYKTQGNYLKMLVRRMAAYASIAQVSSFLRNIRDVTMQFELQRVALGSIIGDLNEANAMFEQIKAAAVKSPFQIKELVTYTKNLAAYKIETDELFETTQRLADISAGLGVGMERLVLAYGQIRATGYLRASEVRQLTEAGIPIVEELAKKMSQLRGETISAAEVMGMISERAVSFGMVKEVFDDMTSAGGMFYKMQEKQAETLSGQWSNLKDSIAIMYEEIGNTDSVNNAMKSVIATIKSLAENWRTVGNVAGWSVGAALGYAKVIKPISDLVKKMNLLNKAEAAYKSAIHLHSIGASESAKAQIKLAKAYRNSATALKVFGGALKSIWAFIKANPIGVLITVITALVSWLISARQEANRLNKELAKIGTEGALQADQSVRNFERLAKAVRESADGSDKQTTALAELKRAYGEFLPSQDKEIINLAREKDGYNAVTQAIREKIALQVKEQKLNTIASEYGSQFSKLEKKISNLSFFKQFSKEEMSLIMNEIKMAVDKGLLSTEQSVEERGNKIIDIIKDITGMDFSGVGGSYFGDYKSIVKLIETQEEYNSQIKEVEDSMESATGSFGKYTQSYKAFKDGLKDVTGMGEKFSFEWNESKTKAEIKAYNDFIAELLTKEGIKFEIGDTIDFKSLYEAIGDNYPQLKQVVAKIQGEYEKLVPKDLEKLIKDQFVTLANNAGASLDKLQLYFKNSETSTQDWVKTLKDGVENLGNKIFDAKKLGKDTKELEAQKSVLEAMVNEWDNSKTASKSAEQALKDELSAVEKIYKRYYDLRKFKSEEDAQSILAKEFEGVNPKTLEKAYSPEKMLQVYKKALEKAKSLGDKDLVLEIETKIGEFNFRESQRELEKDLKRLSDELSHTKAAKGFFDRMLGLTGNKELSATLTMSVFGVPEDGDFGKEIAKKTKEQVQKYFGDIDISSAINKTTGEIDPIKLKALLDSDKMGEDNYNKALLFIDDAIKANANYIESLYQTYEKFLTYEKRKTQILKREAKEREEIAKNELLTEDEKEKFLKASKKRENEELLKVDIEAFKSSSDYVKIFKDLDNLSTQSITRIMDSLDKFLRDNADLFAENPEQLKALTEEYDKLYKELIERKPFKAVGDGLKEYWASIGKVIAARKKLQDAEDGTPEHTKAQKELNEALDEQAEAVNKMTLGFQGAASALSNISSVITDFMEVFNIAEDSEAAAYIQELVKWLGLLSGALSLVASIIAVIEVLAAPLMLVAAGVAAVGAAITYISGKKARDAQKDIESLNESLENLSYAFERLEKAQEKAFGSDYIRNYEKRIANLAAQQEAYSKQAQSERDKEKKEDEEKTKEYEKSAQEAADAISDMYGELSSHFLGQDLASAARDFATAWIDAYKEFSNTTDAMKEKFQDMIQNMIVESLLAKVMERALQPVFDMIDDMQSSDFSSTEFWKKVSVAMNQAAEDGVVGAENVMAMLESVGVNLRELGGDMTGISRDIATASEESILGLAAGINTQNFYISQVPPKLDTIISILRGEGAIPQASAITLQDVMTAQNQYLMHLPSIAQHTADTVARCERAAVACERMADQLDRVIKPRGTQATHTINTSL